MNKRSLESGTIEEKILIRGRSGERELKIRVMSLRVLDPNFTFFFIIVSLNLKHDVSDSLLVLYIFCTTFILLFSSKLILL